MVNKIATVMMVKNEEDIIESSIRHACKISDEVYVCDHMSIDRTMEILKSLQDEGLPLKISIHRKATQNQNEVLNQLTEEAIENGADIVIPTDADEFIIMTGGKNSEDLRKFLQILDRNKIYRLVWISCLFVAPDKDLDQYALARPSFRSVGSSVFDPNPKLIAGVGALKKYDLEISVHYCLKKSDGENFEHHETLKDVVNWHYRFINKKHFISKEMMRFIKRALDATQYSAWYLLNQSMKDFLAGGNYDSQDVFRLGIVDRPYPADFDLAPYKNECINKFSGGGGTNILRNIYKLALDIAEESCTSRIIALNQLVRIFILHDGNSERTNQSIQSAIDQNYPHKKIFVVIIKPMQVESINFQDGISFLTAEKFPDKVMESEGDYVQFIAAGDIIPENRITEMIKFSYAKNQFDVIFSESNPPKNSTITPPIWYIRYRFYHPVCEVEEVSGEQLFSKFLKHGCILQSGITRGFFKQKVFKMRHYIEFWIREGEFLARQFYLWNSIAEVEKIGFMNRKLVDSNESSWSQNQLGIFFRFWINAIEQARGTYLLSEDQYQNARKGLLKWQIK